MLTIWLRELLGPAQAPLADEVTNQAFMLLTLGGAAGYLTLIWLTDAVGRCWSYFLIALSSAVTTIFDVRRNRDDRSADVVHGTGRLLYRRRLWHVCRIPPPELFPTRMRATGEDFCWNMARILTAMGRFGAGVLVGIFGSVPSAGIAVAAVYIVGAVAIWFGPENEGPRDRSLSGDADMICKDLAKPRSRPQSPAPPISSSMPIPSFSSTRWH